MLTRLIDFPKNQGSTTLFTSLPEGGSTAEQSQVSISSLMDTWLMLRNAETGAERNRLLLILKSRGMAHSNQVREFLLTDSGIQLSSTFAVLETNRGMEETLVEEADSCRRLLLTKVKESETSLLCFLFHRPRVLF